MENDEQREYSIGELADEAGVSTRTVRYYVSEGLLPPPVGTGPNSRYTSAHRDQLEIIGRLKAQYLPLKEIRRRLIGHGTPNASAPGPAPLASAPAPDWFRGQTRRTREVAEDRTQLTQFLMADFAGQQLSESTAEPRVHFSMSPPEAAPEPHNQAWRRVAISDEAELLITEDQYRRHQDKIDWLIQWAKRVLEP